ncbi:hypothetical protein SAICODRAFT_95652 [Saitoella complicata NRRL Y-17804]|nr:uncharacterized protein SAICODRAFT_95652 [Saitoella complicata NRRL Y-17804]ODQ51462.1 hypothetical protein SAICODRAFT_95652 [Saitoella complicata NRRL Y-17804]
MSLESTFSELKSAFYESHDHQRCQPLLLKLKVQLAEEGVLVPSPEAPHAKLLIAREALEIGAYTAIHLTSPSTFARYFTQLSPFYFPSLGLPASEHQYPLTGLHLLYLLSESKIAEFHIFLESLAESDLEQKWLKHAVMLERWLMEGSYDRVWRARNEAPADEYLFFMDMLMETIRNEIAECAERAYTVLPLTNAKQIFFLEDESSVVDFANEHEWDVRDSRIYFPAAGATDGDAMMIDGDAQKAGVALKSTGLPTEKMIAQTLEYARELEQIV